MGLNFYEYCAFPAKNNPPQTFLGGVYVVNIVLSSVFSPFYVLNFLKYRANDYRYISDSMIHTSVSHLSRGRAKVDYDDVLTDDETVQLINLFS